MKLITILLFFFLSCKLLFTQNLNSSFNRIKVGDVLFTESTVIFEFAKSKIKPTSYNLLDSIAEFLKKHDSLIIEIGVHTDNRVSDYYSSKLDQKRAKSLLNYLVKKGIIKNNITTKGYGKDNLIISDEEIAILKSDEEKEKAHSVNRRIEFKVIKINSNL